jgi:hypothetical protein
MTDMTPELSATLTSVKDSVESIGKSLEIIQKAVADVIEKLSTLPPVA